MERPTSETLELTFDNPLRSNEYKLFQFPKELLERIEKEENLTLTIKGDADGFAMLCTEDKTYQMIKVETSNAMLLMPKASRNLKDLSPNERYHPIHAYIQHHYEVTQTTPNLLIITQLLSECYYTGEEDDILEETEKQKSTKLYTLSDLEQLCQASRKEILDKLKEINAVEIDGIYIYK